MTEEAPIDFESRRIARQELHENLLVEAGAGSGKTQMLAERMAAGVAAGVYQIEHLAAVTFTRKAASELRGRFHLALEKELQEAGRGPDDGTRAARCARIDAALANLERFFAGTIHSFCARLLRERPVESSVAPGFTELDELQDIEVRRRVWREFVTSTRAAGDPIMMALLEARIRPADLDAAFARVCLHEDVEFPPGEGKCPDPKKARRQLAAFWTTLAKELPANIEHATTCSVQKAARRFRGQFAVSVSGQAAELAALLEIWDGELAITQKWWSDAPAERKRLRDLLNPLLADFRGDVVQPFLSEWRSYVYRLAVTLLVRAREHAARERRRLNTLNYGDLLILTARVLRENAAVRRALQEKYQHLFVDEFQDTDPVQAEIVFLLAAREQPGERATRPEKRSDRVDWRTLPLRPGALFVVGDPKQSIYRFRRADIDIYNIVRERFSRPEIGRVLTLTTNFRSVPRLCNWANEVFATRFPPKPTMHSPRFAALDPLDRPGTHDSGGVFTITHACHFRDVPGQDAAAIARYIRAEVDAGRRRFSDFLVLTRRKRARIVPYAAALEALNVPLEVSGAGAFGESAEVNALIAMLRALSDPQHALALVAVLRGPFFGLSDQELFAFRQSGGWFSIFDRAADDGAEPGDSDRRNTSGVGAALDVVRKYYRWTRLLPAAASLERILEDTGFLALAATSPGGVDAGDLLHAVDRVRCVVQEGGSLADAADALEEDADESSEVESLPLEPGRSDVVRVMNLHKAKGLEAKVVFLADPLGSAGGFVDEHIRRTGSTSQGWFKLTWRSEETYASRLLGQHAEWAAFEAAEIPYRTAEEDRLLYVAATRAQEMLVISRAPAANRAAWGVLNKFLTSATELRVPASIDSCAVRPLTCSPRTRNEAAAAMAASHGRAKTPSWAIASVTASSDAVIRATDFKDAAVDDPTAVLRTDTPTHRADAGAAWGSLLHGLLEHAMRHASATRDDLRRLALWLTVEQPNLRSVIEEALDTVERVKTTPFWGAARGGKHLEEAPFAVVRDGTVLNGVVDLLFQSPDGWHLRDYKTDVVLDPSAYEEQLGAYRTALEMLDCVVVDASLVHVRGPKPPATGKE